MARNIQSDDHTKKHSPDKKKLKKLITTKLVLHEMVKGLLGEGEEGEKKRPKLNNKMAVILNLSTLESKKTNGQAEQKQTHKYREHFNGCQMGGGLKGLTSINW